MKPDTFFVFTLSIHYSFSVNYWLKCEWNVNAYISFGHKGTKKRKTKQNTRTNMHVFKKNSVIALTGMEKYDQSLFFKLYTDECVFFMTLTQDKTNLNFSNLSFPCLFQCLWQNGLNSWTNANWSRFCQNKKLIKSKHSQNLKEKGKPQHTRYYLNNSEILLSL